MKTIVEKKVIEKNVKVYIAEDGTEFNNYSDCHEYERQMRHNKAVEKAEALRVCKLNYVVPLCVHEYFDNDFIWYKLENDDDFGALLSAYTNGTLDEPSSYPEVYCVGAYRGSYHEDAYGHTLSECRRDTEAFWTAMGYKVTFEKIES